MINTEWGSRIPSTASQYQKEDLYSKPLDDHDPKSTQLYIVKSVSKFFGKILTNVLMIIKWKL